MAKEIARYHKKNKKTFPVLIGEKITLRPIVEDEFYEKYYQWLRQIEIIDGIGEEEDMSIQEIIQMHNEWREDLSNLTLGIYDNETGKPVGDINLVDSPDFKKGPEIGIMIGDRGKGFGKEALKLMIDYAFNSIHVSQINLDVYKNNPASNLYQKMGFKITEELKEPETGRDEYKMALTKKEWKEMNKDKK
ncbi:MAG TPA: GNAT family protein [Candidatus Pacearchaeota archaeon]|nr:GNAT family protein [Candidatus Pacearchaeota archaeon]